MTTRWPNGRRLGDDVIDIAEQAVGGFLKDVKLPLGDGVNTDDVRLLDAFPYVADPKSGFDNTKGCRSRSPSVRADPNRVGPAGEAHSEEMPCAHERSSVTGLVTAAVALGSLLGAGAGR